MRVATFILLFMLVATAALAHGGPGGNVLDTTRRTADNAVGPIYYGEPMTSVWKTLGKAAVSRRCESGPPCASARYTDGANLLVIEYVPSNPAVSLIRVYAHRRPSDAARLPAPAGALAAWRWHGLSLLRSPAPRAVPGWQREPGNGMTSYEYGHGCGVTYADAPQLPSFTFYCE